MTKAPKYPITQINIFLENRPNHQEGRDTAKEGDIITVKQFEERARYAGIKVRSRRLFLMVEGLERAAMLRLKERYIDPYPVDKSDPMWDTENYGKRRYCIPLERIKELFPTFDIDRAKDLNDEYQPFLTLDTETGYWLSNEAAVMVNGLIFDKITGEYL